MPAAKKCRVKWTTSTWAPRVWHALVGGGPLGGKMFELHQPWPGKQKFVLYTPIQQKEIHVKSRREATALVKKLACKR